MRAQLVLVTGLLLSFGGFGTAEARANRPVIADYGAIAPVEGARERPDHSLRYQVVFSVTRAAATPDAINPSLERVARFLNLLGADGVRPRPGDVVVVVSGPATPTVMEEAAYAKKTGAAANPNLPLIAALHRAGVSVRVCSQALVGNQIRPASVARDVQIDVSAMTSLATLQLRGWAFIPD